MDKPRSALELDQKGIPYKLASHPNSAHTAVDAAGELGFEVGQIVKTLLVHGRAQPPILVLATGDKQIHFGKLGKILGDKSVFLCSPEKTLEITGYPVGLVTAFGLKTPLKVVIEETVLTRDTIAVSSGILGFEIVMSPRDLLKATGGVVYSFVK